MGTGYNQNGEPCGHCTGPNRTRERSNCNCNGEPPRSYNYRSDHLVRTAEVDIPVREDADIIARMADSGERFLQDPSRWAQAATIATAASAAAAHGMFDRVDITHPAGFLFTTGVATGGMWLARRWQQGRQDKQNRDLVRQHIDVDTTKLNSYGYSVRGSEVDNWAVMNQEPLTFGYAGTTVNGWSNKEPVRSVNYLCKQREDGRWDWEGEFSTRDGETQSYTGTADTPQRGRDELVHVGEQEIEKVGEEARQEKERKEKSALQAKVESDERQLASIRKNAERFGLPVESMPSNADEAYRWYATHPTIKAIAEQEEATRAALGDSLL